jgi:murein DD-endopeptidase MepM/ murein hydrolase activator NlpD
VKARLAVALCLGVAAFGLAVSASASPPVGLGPPATAEGLAIQVVGSDETTLAATADASAPPSATLADAPFAYPDDGAIVSADSTTVEVYASAGDGTASALTEVDRLSLFGGEITAESARGSSSSAGTIGDTSDSALTGLSILGLPVAVSANARVPIADWGYAVLLPQSTTKGTAQKPSWRGTVSALVVHITVDHGGLTAGSEIRIGYAEAYARPPEAPAPTTTASKPAKTPTTTPSRVQLPPPSFAAGIGVQAVKKPKKKSKKSGLPLVLSPPTVTPKLTAGGYVFPVYGPSGYGDTFGAPRGDVSGGWHHGDDIFAPLGAPLLAVADGTVFSVGWNDVGGWRLWLRDRKGNEFYYAHLSAYTKLAHNGARVKAGQVLGFVGNTGDAEGTPFHLHFEVHPVAMLFLGYDGAVNPTEYLDAWKRLADVRILPAVPFSQPQAEISKNAPAPGAILLEASDISTANGLDPASLKRAMRGQPAFDVTGTGVGQLPTPLPNLDRA